MVSGNWGTSRDCPTLSQKTRKDGPPSFVFGPGGNEDLPGSIAGVADCGIFCGPFLVVRLVRESVSDPRTSADFASSYCSMTTISGSRPGVTSTKKMVEPLVTTAVEGPPLPVPSVLML